jgi:predicted MFS family arabinose efflux permease
MPSNRHPDADLRTPPQPAAPPTPAAAVRHAVSAVYIVFIGSGLAFASWASRIPQVRDRLEVTPAQLGLLLWCIAVGSVIAMPLSGLVVSRFGEARTVAVMATTLAIGLATVAVGFTRDVTPVAIGLFLMGFGNGTWDVAMNVQGAAVEQLLRRAIMSRFHAGFSVGTVAGALIGSLMVALHVSVTIHLLAVAGAVAAVVPTSTRWFLPHAAAVEGHPEDQHSRSPLAAWTEPRTLLIGVLVLCMAFTEGTGNDWLGVAVIDGYHAAAVLGSLALAVFVASMTAGRWFGPGLIDRYGRVPILRGSAFIAFVGLLLVVFGSVLPLAMAGVVLWGLGAALGFPVGMSAAADDPRRSAGRVSVVASIGYVAFLAGPPAIGLLGDHVGVLRALTIAAGLLAIAVLVAGACKPLAVAAPATGPGSRPGNESPAELNLSQPR